MKRILVNATQREELRVALVDGQKLCNLDIEPTSLQYKKGDIYKAVVTSIAQSLNAVFVNYGSERHGFLPFREISYKYLRAGVRPSRSTPIKELIRVGDELPVQITREERGEKGALLTTNISLVSRYLVFMPGNPRARGISQRIEGVEREQAQEAVSALNKKGDEGIIVRTSGTGRASNELQNDLDYLRNLWKALQQAIDQSTAPEMLYRESNIVIQAIRDHLHDDIEKVLIDDRKVYKEVKQFVDKMMPDYVGKIQLYEGAAPLFSHAQIERQIEYIFEREVTLPSGGALVIDHTEALTTIDINSARSIRGSDIEETALSTNLEAAEEIAKQLHLRDLGGLVVIDFIDMMSDTNRRKVEDRLRQSIKQDRARTQLGRISHFGLLEMSRQRLRPSLGDTSRMICPRCSGNGFIRTPESCALAIIRLVEEEAVKESVARVMVEVPTNVCDFLLNKKRADIDAIEAQHKVEISILSDLNMETPHYRVTGQRADLTVVHRNVDEPEMTDDQENARYERDEPHKRQAMQPAVTMFSIDMPSPSLFLRFLKRLFQNSVLSPSRLMRKKPKGRYKYFRRSRRRRYSKPRGNRQSVQSKPFYTRRSSQGGQRTRQSTRRPRQKPTDQTAAYGSSSRSASHNGRPRNHRSYGAYNNRASDKYGKRSVGPQSGDRSKGRARQAPPPSKPSQPSPQSPQSQPSPSSKLPQVGVAKAPSDSTAFSSGSSRMVQVETKK